MIVSLVNINTDADVNFAFQLEHLVTGFTMFACMRAAQEKPIVEVMDTELPVRLRILPAQCKQNSREYAVEYCSADVGNSHCTGSRRIIQT